MDGLVDGHGSGRSVSRRELRALIGVDVAADTIAGPITGRLLSCTSRSAWIVAGDVDHVVALPHLRRIHPR